MADKAEIIEITFYNKRGWGERLPQMTRAEALERMAKAMCQTSGRGCNECAVKNKPRNCKKILLFGGIVNKAEAALDALLGGKNG